MKITKLEKEVLFDEKKVRIVVSIEATFRDLKHLDYKGFDCLPDAMIPDILTAVGRMYKILRNGKLERTSGIAPHISKEEQDEIQEDTTSAEEKLEALEKHGGN